MIHDLRIKKKYWLPTLTLLFSFCIFHFAFFIPSPAHAETGTPDQYKATQSFLKGAGYNAPTQQTKCTTNAQGVQTCVPSTDIRAYIMNFIKFVLTVVGFLFFALLVYAGYLWTAAGGNDEMVKKAQSTATKAIVGFGIILAAYAITIFITNVLQKSIAP